MAAAIIDREEVPGRLRHLLNVESGVNDGSALPAVLQLLNVLRDEPVHPLVQGGNLLLGAAIGQFGAHRSRVNRGQRGLVRGASVLVRKH